MATSPSNKCKYLLLKKVIDFSADSFKIILMQSGFSFDKDTHEGYANVSASEVANGNGYTTGGAVLAGVSVTEDDTADLGKVTWTNPSWTASGGDITASGAIIYDDTVSSPTADPIIGYIDFGGDITQANGGTFTIANPMVRIL